MTLRPSQECPICLAASTRPAVMKDGHLVLQCSNCRFRFAADAPPASAEELYSARYFRGDVEYGDYCGDEPVHRRQARRYLRRLDRLGLLGRRLLDVGCAAGFFVDEARRAGWEAEGLEVSEYAAEFGRDELGLEVHRADLLSADLPPASYDVVTAFNTLEHIPEPRRAAARLQRLIRPGGYLALETWDADSPVARVLGPRWHQYDPVHVPSYFNRSSLHRLFEPAQWMLVDYRATAKWVSIGRGCSVLEHGFRRTALGPVFNRLARSPLARAEVPYALGDLVWVVLQRTRRRADRERPGFALRRRPSPWRGGAERRAALLRHS